MSELDTLKANGGTLLKIDGIVLPIGSAYGLSQSLDPVDNGPIEYDINGNAIDFSNSNLKKFTSSISGSTPRAPATFGLWRGANVTVECIPHISETVYGAGPFTLTRSAVSGTVRAFKPDWTEIAVIFVAGKDVTLDDFTGSAFIQYRPVISFVVNTLSVSKDEYGSFSWTADLMEA